MTDIVETKYKKKKINIYFQLRCQGQCIFSNAEAWLCCESTWLLLVSHMHVLSCEDVKRRDVLSQVLLTALEHWKLRQS